MLSDNDVGAAEDTSYSSDERGGTLFTRRRPRPLGQGGPPERGAEGEGDPTHLTNHHTHVESDSRFCSVDCTVAYLEDGPVEGVRRS